MEKSGNKIKELRKDRQLTLEQLSERSGLSVSYLQRLESGNRNLSVKMLNKIAAALSATPRAILPDDPTSGSQVAPTLQKIGTLNIVGEVAAGVWREEISDAWEPEPYDVPADIRFPVESQFLLRVIGTSINRKAQPGSLVRCLKALDAPREPRDGDWVVVRRMRNGFAEMTVKKLKLGAKNKLEPWPDSDDPKWQEPLQIGAHDGDEVFVHAFVLDFIAPGTQF